MKEKSLSSKMRADGGPSFVWSKDVKEAVSDIMKELESNLIQGNKLNFTKTISTIKRRMGDKLT